MKITITQDISDQRIFDLLTSALEGGSNYWYMLEEKIEPSEWLFLEEMRPQTQTHWAQEYALSQDGALIIGDEESDNGDTYRLDRKAIKKGLQLMSTNEPSAMADFMTEDEDATTGDIFLQLCLFGKVIYG